MLGPTDLETHLAHALGFWQVLSDAGSHHGQALDLGSGGGLPGLVIASGDGARCFRWTLLDSRQRSVDFLEMASQALGLQEAVEVRAGRAEELAHTELRGSFDVVCARGFGPPPVTAECAAGFLRHGGLLVVSDPPGEAGGERRWGQVESGGLGFGRPQAVVQEVLDGDQIHAFHYQRVEMVGECPARFPRRTGVPIKRPLF